MPAKLCCRFVFVMVAALAASSPAVVFADDSPADAEPPTTIRFSFKGATFEQVVDFFARSSGLPVVWETEPPEGTLDFLSPEAYDLAEAMQVLNIILQSKGVMLRLDDDMLYLQKLTEMQRENIPTYVGTVPAEITDDQIVTVVIPLSIAVAGPLAEKLASMVGAYGAVAAMDQQNALVLTETAAQVRRITKIIHELDRADPEGAVEIIAIRYAQASKLMEPLKALLSRTVERLVMDKNNKPQKVKEQEMSGLNIAADDRTNAIIAKGVQSRIDKLKQAIVLLDTPSTGESRSMLTFTLTRLTPGDATRILGELYAKMPDEERPTLLALEDVGKLTIVGTPTALAEARTVLAHVDGVQAADLGFGAGESVIVMVPVDRAPPAAIIQALNGLLSARQSAVTRVLAGPDGRSIVVSGPASEVAGVRDIIPVLDRSPRIDRNVRLLRLTTADPATTLEKARRLFDREVEASDRESDPAMSLRLDFDPDSRMLTMIGSSAALDRFASALRTIENAAVVDRETRQIALDHAVPSRVTSALTALAKQLLTPRDGAPFVAPAIEAVDPLDLLIVTALPEQFAVIESLVDTLDRPDPGEEQFRVLSLAGVADVAALQERAGEAYARLARGYEPRDLPDPEVEHDALTGNLIVTGRREAVALYERALAEARRLLPAARTGRLIELRQADAADVIEPLRELWLRTAIDDPTRTVREPEIELVERTNSIYVVAEPAQHSTIERYVRSLDKLEPGALPPLRLLQIRAADSTQLASMLKRRYDARSTEQRRDEPVTIDADPATNTLIVTAHEAVFEEIREFVDSVNRAEEGRAERHTMIFPLRRARAADLAMALDKLYPEPPMPLDRRGRPMPHLREPREVYVSADPATNTLIIEAPAERRASFETLVEQLDRVELPATAELRTYRIERGDPTLIARTLSELAQRGVLSDQPEDGSKPVEVLIQAEPRSRTLIVAGDEVTFTQTERILKDLEVVPVERSLRVFEVTGTDAQTIADQALSLYEEQTADIPDARPVSIDVNADRGTILAIAEDEAMFRFAAILNQLQATIGPPPDVRLHPLEYADASEVVEIMRDMAETHLAMVGNRAGPVPMFEAIDRTNSVLVAARPDQHAIILALLRALDRIEPTEMPPLRILQLRTADAANLASALMRQYDRRPVEERGEKPVNITADPNTNALVIAAHPDMLPEIEAIVTDLNAVGRMDSEGREIRIFPLKVARAEELARTLDEMFPAPPVPRDSRGRPLPHLQGPPEVVVRADAQTNSIIVDAPMQRMPGFEKLVEQLDRARIVEETEVRTYPVVHAELEMLAATLRELAGSGALHPMSDNRRVPIVVSTEPVSRTLIVSGPTDIFPRVEQVMNELDIRRLAPTTVLRFFRLEFARADAIAPMLREILLSRLAEDVPEAGSDAAALLNVTADRKTNTLILSAPEPMMAVAEELIRQLDSPAASVGDPVVRIRPLTFADAREVGTTLNGALAGVISAVTGEPIDARIIPAPGSNALILVGLEADLKELEKLIEPLDERPGLDAVGARTFALTHAEASQMAPVLRSLLTDQLANDPRVLWERIRRSRGDIQLPPTVRVEADERTNSLIVSGTGQTVALAETLIRELDRPGPTGHVYRTFTPESADPTALADAVSRIMEATRPGAGPASVRLLPEPGSGAVVVIGAPDEVQAAIDLLTERDRRTLAPPQMDLRVVSIEYGDPTALARMVGSLLADRTRWPETLRRIERAGIPVAAPTVTPDTAASRVLVSAPAPLMPLAVELLGELDRAPEGRAAMDVRVFTLEQADAKGVAAAIESAMTAQARGRPGAPTPTVIAEPSSGSIVVTASPEQMSEIESIVTRLDQSYGSDQTQVRAVYLEHARAETVAPIIEQLLASPQVPEWALHDALRRGRPQPDFGPQVRVAPDVRLNAVVISAPAALLNIAEEMVRQLDVAAGGNAGRGRSVRVIHVHNADASELAANIEALFDVDDATETPPTIRVDRGSNSLLVRATDAQFKTIETLTRAIDDATVASARQLRLIPIDPSKASAAEVARTLDQMLDRADEDRIEVITLDELLRRQADDASPAGDPAAGDPPPGGTSMRGSEGRPEASAEGSAGNMPRPFGVAIVAMLALVMQDDAAAAAIERGSDVTIAVDPETNSLIVIGAPKAIERLASFAEQVQDQLPAEPGEVHYISLPADSDAATLARLLDQTLRRLTPVGGAPGDLRRRVAVVADTTNNAIVVVAGDTDFETIAELIAVLASPPAPDPTVVKIYQLETISADRAALSVEQLVAPDGRPRGRQAQRMRTLAVKLLAGDRSIDAVFAPGEVHVAADMHSNALVVRAPQEAIELIDSFIELIDQRPVNVQTTLKLYPLRHAIAGDLQSTLRDIYRARSRNTQGQPGIRAIQPEFAADKRTNTLLVTASPEHLAEVDDLLQQLDRQTGEDVHELRVIEMTAALPSRAAELLDLVVIGSDQERRNTTQIVPDDDSGVILVRASKDVNDEIDRVLTEIDRDAAQGFEVRTITVERADAAAVASAIQRFYDDRARIASQGRGRRAQSRRVSVMGDPASKTILVAASDDDFAEIETLVAQFDSPQASDVLAFRVFQLRHAKATEIEDTVNNLISDLTWNQGPIFFFGFGRGGFGGRNQSQRRQGTVAVRADSRLNALIATGEGDKFDMVEQLIEVLDAPPGQDDARFVKLYRIEHAELQTVADVVRELFTDTSRARRWWMPADPNEVKIRQDDRSRTLIVSATGREHDEIEDLVSRIDTGVATPGQETAVISIEYAQVAEIERSLRRFLIDRARAAGERNPTATIMASPSTNSLVIAAQPDELATLRDLLAQLDQPDVSGDRVIEIIVLQEGEAEEIARIIREQFARRGGQGVVVTADNRTSSLIINAPRREFAQAKALVEQLDSPTSSDEVIIRTYVLEGSRAEDVVRILTATLQLDARGETAGITIRLDEDSPPVEVKAKIVADARSNSVIITATEESFPVIASLIQQIDEVPAASPVEYRVIVLKHAMADDVAYTLGRVGQWRDDGQPQPRFDYNRVENQLIVAATADQFEQIDQILTQLDVPSRRERITNFVALEFAEAEKLQEALSVFYGPYAMEADTPGKRNVSIVADPATNSLVISADEAEWENIRALLAELDSAEYDSSLQLQVIPLVYADARSVADAINQAFQGPLERGRRGDQGGRGGRGGSGGTGGGNADGERRDATPPLVLVESEEWVRASAERQTNSVIVSASRKNLRKIEQIIEQLDVADFAKLPAPRLIPVVQGSPASLADALNQLYEQDEDRGGKALRIVGDEASGTVIVRAEEEEYQQILALAEALQQQSAHGGLSVRVIRLHSAPARRVADAITAAYERKADETNQPFSISVDAAGNSLIVASTAGLFAEIEATCTQLDALAPAAGQGIFIIELENVSPEAAKSIIETIGLDRPVADDAVARLVTEPIMISVLDGRNAVIVVANPVDRETIVSLFKAIDAEPALAEAQVRIVKLQNARASSLARILTAVFSPADQQADTPLARAVQEQVRRLTVRGDGLDDEELRLDLTEPIRIVPDDAMNAIIVSSTASNVAAVEELVRLFDTLPITDAVTVQLFPLENIAADAFVQIVRDLFDQGKQLAAVPGTDLRGVPGGTVGRALLDEIAMSIDQRTNTVIVAGKDDSVAFVEVLAKRLDSEIAIGWIEPRIIPLKFADATDLASTLQSVLVDGQSSLSQAGPLQEQIGRLRMARTKGNGGRVLESDVYQPMSRLLIRPEPQLNALILVGTPINLEIVTELITMLDTEASSPDATVRIYPVANASASRLQTIITNLFDQQVESKAIRPEDRVIVQADERTNSIIVTTSPRSFAVLEGLLDALDSEIAPDLREIRRIPLENASAARLAPLIQDLMDARLERLRQVQPETAELERASIVADPRSNSLVVAAGNESFTVIERLATDLDGSMINDSSLVRVVPVDSGNVDRIAEAINAVMARRYADMPAELRDSQKPLVFTDPRTKSLLVAANPEDLNAIEDLVAKITAVPTDPAVGLHVLNLPATSSAVRLAPRIQRLMRDRLQSLGDARQPSDNVTVEPDEVSNTLIVAATDENVEIIRGLIDVLVQSELYAIAGRGFEIIPLVASRAGDMLDLLNDLYVDEANRIRGDGTVQVTADDHINAILVNAPPSDLRVIQDLVAQLDGAEPTSVVEIKYIALESADAFETVRLIQNVLSGQGIGSRSGSTQAKVLKYLRTIERTLVEDDPDVDPDADPDELPEGTEMQVSAVVRESISLTPDVRTNTIIVSAPATSMVMIERMIRDLDDSTTGAKSIRIFKLVNADAAAMAEILTDLFNLRQNNNLLVLKPREQFDGVEPGMPGASTGTGGGLLGGTELTAVPDERQQLSITVDNRTNSLLVSATPRYLDLVSEVVNELDQLEANNRDVFVYHLRNAEALEVARVLGEFVAEEQQKLVNTLSADQIGSAARLLEREITIRGDEKSNSVLVSASPRYMESVKDMIRQLDVDPPQVLIQVLLAEVTLDSTDDWGVDASFSFGVDSATVSGGYGLASSFVPAMGVPFLAVASTDFQLLIRALQEQGRIGVLSNPSIMVANNESARIQIGENIRVAEATSFTDAGQSNTTLTEEELGVQLSVTPSINPDGYVRLKITPTISNLTQREIQINEDLSTPIITIRTAETTVTVHDGQTIILGGLISDRFERRTRKVPILGDLPLIGMMFRSETEQRAKTELVIVLTPHVIESPTNWGRVDELTGREVDRLTLPDFVKDRIRDGTFDFTGGLFDAEGNPIDFSLEDAIEHPEVEPDEGQR